MSHRPAEPRPQPCHVFRLAHIQLSRVFMRWAQMFPYDKTKIRNAFEQPAPCLPLSFASCCPQRPGLSILSICLAPAVYQGYLKKRRESSQSITLPTNLTSHDVGVDYPVCGCSWVFIFLTIKPLFKDLVCRCGSVVECLACLHPWVQSHHCIKGAW